MKIKFGRHAQDIKITDDDGKDLLEKLNLFSINVSVEAGEETIVIMKCHVKEVDISGIPDENIQIIN